MKMLKIMAAAAIAASTLVMGSMCVFADTFTWKAGESKDWVTFNAGTDTSNGWTEATNTDSSCQAVFSENIFDDGTAALKGQPGMQSENSKDTITITTTGNNAHLKMYVARGGNSDANSLSIYLNGDKNNAGTTSGEKSTETIKPVEFDIATAGANTISFSNSKAKVFLMELTDEAAVTEKYTITAKDLISGKTVNDIEVKDSTGKAAEKQTGSYTLNVGKTYTVSASDYGDTSFVPVSGDNEVTVYLIPDGTPTYTLDTSTISDSNITVADNMEAGDNKLFYVEKNVKTTSSRIQVQTSSGVKFKLTSGGRVTLTGAASSSSGESNKRTIYVVNDNDKENPNPPFKTPEPVDNTKANYTFDILEPGTYYFYGKDGNINVDSITVTGKLIPVLTEIVTGETDGNVTIVKENEKYYAVAIVSSDEAEANTAVTFTAGTNNKKLDTVYDAIKINDHQYTKDLLGGKEGNYVCGVELDVNQVSGSNLTAEGLQGKVTAACSAE